MYGNYPSQQINCKNMIDHPKYLNENQALLKCKVHMTVELY